jgi:hypothetical protein
MKNKVVIIAVYFGPFPSYFNLFKKTAFFNKDYDWMIFTDQVQQIIREQNILYIPYNLKIFNKKISTLLKTDIKITEPIKLCDARPCFAAVFNYFVEGYDWWGWTDLDLLNGNFNNFINDNVLDNHDVITTINRPGIYGPFTLVSMKHKNLYKEIKKYGQLLSAKNPDDEHGCFYIDKKHFYTVMEKNNINIYKGEIKEEHLIEIIYTGKRKLPAIWENGNVEIASYGGERDKRCDTMIYHVPKNHTKIFHVDEKIIVA